MADWRGRGGGRVPGQPSNTFSGGAGAGGGRAGAQPNPSISGGAGKGGGRGGSQPTAQANSSVQLAARGFTLQGSTTIALGKVSAGLKAKVEFGGSSTRVKAQIGAGAAGQRAGSTLKSSSGEMNPRVADPEGNFIFTLEIDGIEVAQFKECSGLKSSTQIFELEEGGMNHRVHKLAGQSRWENITLRYGVTSDTSLLKWRNEVLQDEFNKRRNGSVVMLTLQRQEVRRFNFVQAWPVAWEGPSFDANAADLAVEMIEIAHHGISIS